MAIPSSTARKVFLLGPGYVGREIVDRLLAQQYSVSTIARRDEAIKEFEQDGITAVKGDLNDSALIQRLAAQADVVFHTATADHLPSAVAILEAVKQRAEKGKHTIYLHQSGASFVSDNANGKFKSDVVYSDSKPKELDALPDTASHRQIDLAIIKARQELATKAKIFIMMPAIIYGANAKYGRLSIQIPTLARFARKYGFAGVIEKGESVWGVIHVRDLAQAYMTLLHWASTSPPETALQHPYFFCENGEMSWGEIAKVIGTSLQKAGVIDDATPRLIPRELYSDLFGEYSPLIVASNARIRAERLRRLGWQPTEKSFDVAFEEEELSLLLREKGSFAGYGRAVAS